MTMRASCKFAHIALLAHCVSQFRKKKELISPPSRSIHVDARIVRFDQKRPLLIISVSDVSSMYSMRENDLQFDSQKNSCMNLIMDWQWRTQETKISRFHGIADDVDSLGNTVKIIYIILYVYIY